MISSKSRDIAHVLIALAMASGMLSGPAREALDRLVQWVAQRSILAEPVPRFAVSGDLPVQVFASDRAFQGMSLYSHMFGGLYAWIQSCPIWIILIPAAIFTALCFNLTLYPERSIKRHRWALAVACLSSAVLAIRLGNGWDEMFINLRHSFMLMHRGVFSFNYKETAEATVDFLPLFMVGILGKLGIPLPEALIGFSLLGNVLIILATYRISNAITKNGTISVIVAALVGHLPPVLYVGATGFTATLFCGALLWVIYGIFYSPSPRTAIFSWVLLGLLTWIRIEGFLLALLIFLHSLLSPDRRLRSLHALIVFMPFLISLLCRKWAYGHYIPTPVSFKTTGLSPVLLDSGIRQIGDLVLGLRLDIVLLGWLLLRDSRRGLGKGKYESLPPLMLIILFSIPFFYSGGDWFPAQWCRYAMPLVVFACLLFFTELLPSLFFHAISTTLERA